MDNSDFWEVNSITDSDRANAFVRSSPDVIFRLNLNGEIISINAPAETLITPEEDIEIGRSIKYLIDPRFANQFDELFQRAIDTKEVQLFHHELVHSGKTFYFEARIVQSTAEEILFVVRDVSELKKAQILNKVLYNIALKSCNLDRSIEEFCHDIETELGRLMYVGEFYISTLDGGDILTFIHMNDSTYEGIVPFSRKRGKGLSEYVIGSGKPLILNGDEIEDFQRDQDITVYGQHAQSWIGAPIVYNGESIGILACQSYEHQNLYTQSDLEILSTIGGQIGLWLERKKLELEQAEFIRIFESSVNEIYIFDAERLNFQFVNKGARENLGYSLEELREMNPLDLKKTMTREEFDELMDPLNKGIVEHVRFETCHFRKDGSRYPVAVYVQASDFRGKPSMTAIILDITEQKKAREELMEYARFFDVSMEFMCVADTNGYFRKVNPLFNEILGYSNEELLGRPFVDFVHPDDINATIKETEQLANGMPSINFTNRYRKANGDYIWLSWHCAPSNDDGMLYATARDVTKLKYAENALKENVAQFRSLAENAPNIIAKVNRKYIVEYVNRGFDNVSPQQVVGSEAMSFVYPENRIFVQKEIEKVFKTGEPVYYSTERISSTGDENYYGTNVGPIFDDYGNVDSVILIIQDLTEQTLAQREIENRYKEMQLIDRVTQASLEDKSIDDLIDMTMNTLPELGSIASGRFYMYNAELDSLELRQQRLDSNLIKQIQKKTGVQINSLIPSISDGGIFQNAIRSHKIVVANDPNEIESIIAEHTDNKALKLLSRWAQNLINIKTFMIVPLVTNKQVFGLMTLTSDSILDESAIQLITRFTKGITASLAKTYAEQESKTQKRFVEDVLNNIPADIAVFSADHRYLYVNSAAIKDKSMRNWIIGRDDFDYCELKGISTEMAEKRRSLFQMAISNQSDIDWTAEQDVNGELRYILRRYHPIFNGNELKYVVGYGLDITDRKLAERKLRDERQRLNYIIQGADMGTWEWNIQYGQVIINDRTAELLGYSKEQLWPLNFRRWKELIHPDDILRSERNMEDHLNGDSEYYNLECRMRHKDGIWVWVQNRGKVASWNAEGKPLWMFGTILDISERKKIEEHIRESEERYRTLFEKMNEGLVLVSPTGRIMMANPKFLTMTGYTDLELVGETGHELLFDNQAIKDHYRRIDERKQGNSENYNTKLVRKNGEIIWVAVSASPQFNTSGEFVGTLSIIKDITEEMRSQRELELSEERLREAQRVARLGNWEWDLLSDTVNLSEEIYEMFELRLNEEHLTFDQFLRSITPEQAPNVEQVFRDAIKNKSTIHLTCQLAHKELYVEILGKVQLDLLGNVESLFGTAMNVTERVEAEKVKEEFTRSLERMVTERTRELEELQIENKYQLDTLNEIAMVSITDTQGKLTYVNDVFLKTTGYTQEELIGQDHMVLKSQDTIETFQEIWETVQRGDTWKGEYLSSTKHGHKFWTYLTMVPFFNVEGEIDKYVAVRFNISEQKEMQKQLEESLVKEQELGLLKSRFVSTASHQFRTPLAIIQSNSELLDMITSRFGHEKKDSLDKATARIRNEVVRMTNLMDEILILGKITAGKMQAKIALDSIEQICQELCEKYDQIQTDYRSVNYTVFGKPVDLNIDSVLITHAISNLLSNAFKYSTTENPELELHFNETGVTLLVSDKGMGIPEDDIPNLFQAFHRGTNVGEISGTGLGLAIVKEYVELNHGTIAVQSRENEGTTFTISLPYIN